MRQKIYINHIFANFFNSPFLYLDPSSHVIPSFICFWYKELGFDLLKSRYPGSELLQLLFVWKRFYFNSIFKKTLFYFCFQIPEYRIIGSQDLSSIYLSSLYLLSSNTSFLCLLTCTVSGKKSAVILTFAPLLPIFSLYF